MSEFLICLHITDTAPPLLSTSKSTLCETSGIYAEVVTFVAGSLEAGGLPGYLEVLV
jgi:hypothetical protein